MLVRIKHSKHDWDSVSRNIFRILSFQKYLKTMLFNMQESIGVVTCVLFKRESQFSAHRIIHLLSPAECHGIFLEISESKCN